jgi:hypothetical protein
MTVRNFYEPRGLDRTGRADVSGNQMFQSEIAEGIQGIVYSSVDVCRSRGALLAAIFLKIDALVIAIMIAGFIAHQLTALWDVTFANDKRRVTPIEQQVQSFLELMPLTGVVIFTFQLAAISKPVRAESGGCPFSHRV